MDEHSRTRAMYHIGAQRFKMWIWSLLIGLYMLQGVEGNKTEYQLVTGLFASYDKSVRPVETQSEIIVAKIGMALIQIIDLDERNQAITIKAYMRYVWTDSNLRWKESEYRGITRLHLDATRIWKPDITLYSDLGEAAGDLANMYPATVYSDGTVIWNFPEVMRSTCNLDVTYFPWDEQRCAFQFGSWSFDGGSLDIVNRSASGDLSFFVTNGAWEMVAFPHKREVLYYACCVYPFPSLTFYIIIRRKPLYYLFNLVLPAVLLTATSVLVFYLPSDSGEKVSLGVTVLLALTVFLLLVADIMPPQSDSVPIIGQFFGATIVLLALSSVLTVIIINLHHRGSFSNDVPYWIRKLVLDWLARLLLLKDRVDANLSPSKSAKVSDDTEANGSKGRMIQVMSASATPPPPLSDCPTVEVSDNISGGTLTDTALVRIINILNEFRESHLSSKREESCRTDWMLVAMVIDRFLLFVFIFLTIVVSTAILCNHPTYVDGVYDPV